MIECGLCLALQFRDNSLSQHLPQLDAPLVERVKIPDHALREDRVFVEGDKFPERFRCELISENDVRGRLPSKTRWGRAIPECPRLLLLPPIYQRPVPQPERRHSPEAIVMRPIGLSDGVNAMKSHGMSRRSLMNQLIEGVLPICTGLAPVDRDWCRNPRSRFRASRRFPLLSIVNCCR